ncbi:hypothetical protein AVEN_179286-1 [Araneus ventricosus]|uniref:RNase H type-1 domain-containing protein n=1 Tax=Araneus ventricosus TaxID=182803 RepID=A0A4Y2FXX3_ARAVE|nr:hypothetical protein AVEN_191670-1 [Araneus ventricosus]GBM46132.1 hypothetical protein AVEN_72546-1 [Araneus ventricosus]GBM46183.1 hypothetical protein AVEN_128859-1 [Araneus ventricosus]GBM46261.1 hypothetical protein AVEN_179286-1 [Araneus ventricosus]
MAHRRVEGNESAAQLAKLADFSFSPSRIKIINVVWRHGKNVGQVVLKLDGPIHCKAKWTIMDFLNQVFTSHGVFPSHQASFFGKKPQWPCRRGECSVIHILLECHKWVHLTQSWTIN